MHPDTRLAWRTLRIPWRIIEHVFGRGNLDDAGDELVYALRISSAGSAPGRYRFAIDSSLGSHHFDEMIFEVEGISEAAWEHFLERVAALGLIEDRPSAGQADPTEAARRRRKG